MSLETHAFMARDGLPDLARWQAAIDAAGLPLQLHPELDLSKDSGFSPCKLKGEDSGFEIYVDEAKELLASYPHLEERLAGQDCAVSFRWGGDMKECACVLAAAYALAKDFDAVVYYPDDDMVYSLDELLEETNQCLAKCG